MRVKVYFKNVSESYKTHFNVVETYVCPQDNEFSVYKDNDETIRYEMDRISAIVTNE